MLLEIASLLVNTLLGLIIAVFIIRLLLAKSGVSPFNPIVKFVVNITNPGLAPLRKILPSIGRFDTANALVILALSCLKIAILLLLKFGSVSALVILWLGVKEAIVWVIYVYIIALILQAVLSWVQQYNHPVGEVALAISRPLLSPIQRFMPNIAGIDLSPLVLILLLQMALIVVNNL